MPSARRVILGHVMSGICSKMNRTKRLDSDSMETPLRRCLTTFDMTLLGVGHMVGAGIYVLTGSVAHSIAGPGVIISFVLAALASLLAALCYAEFGSKVPKAGSAYVYTYVSIGEFWAFIIGWNMIIEHTVGAASVARAWSGYVDSLAGGPFKNITLQLLSAINGYEITELKDVSSKVIPDPIASLLCILYAFLLVCGVKVSARLNSALTLVNIAVILLVIGAGFQYIDFNNWSDENHGGFFPFGFEGVLKGAGFCFYAFVGFDSIASSGEEALNPSKSIPLATGLSMTIVTIGYVLLSGMITLIVPYWQIDPKAALPEAFGAKGVTWAKYVITIGALCGMTTTLFGSIFSLPRIMYAMASDGLLCPYLAKVNDKIKLPIFNIFISALFCAIIAFLFDLDHLVEFMSIGTLLAYTIVSASVIILRYRPDNQINQVLPKYQSNGKKSINDPRSPTSDCSSSSSSSSSSSADSSSPDDSETCPIEPIKRTGMIKLRYARLSHLIGNWEPGTAVTISVVIFTATCICQCICAMYPFISIDCWTNVVLHAQFLIIMIACIFVMRIHEENSTTDKFRVPMVPELPALSIYINIILMCNLHAITWVRFFFWMFGGMLVYFLYGIHHSKEASNNSYSVLMTQTEVEKADTSNKLSDFRFKAARGQSKTNSDKLPILTSDSYHS